MFADEAFEKVAEPAAPSLPRLLRRTYEPVRTNDKERMDRGAAPILEIQEGRPWHRRSVLGKPDIYAPGEGRADRRDTRGPFR